MDKTVNEHIPQWQRGLMLSLPFTKKIFGYEFEMFYKSIDETVVTLKKRGKTLAMRSFKLRIVGDKNLPTFKI